MILIKNTRYSGSLKVLFIIFILYYLGDLELLFNNKNSSSPSPSSSPLTTLSPEDLLQSTLTQEPSSPSSSPSPIISPDSTEDISTNLKYCGEPECKFIFVYTIFGEQETRLSLHFSSFARLAITLNRTLVLTNVGHSEMDACSDFPFEFYYDIEQLKKNMPGLQVITQKDFYNWIEERNFKPNVTLSRMTRDEPKFTTSKPSRQRFENDKDKKCYDSLNLKPIDYKEIYCGADARGDFGNSYRKKMRKFLTQEFDTNVEILLIRYNLYGGAFMQTESILVYSKHIIEASSRVVDRLKPYIAIHWRMEKANDKLAPKCSSQLVKFIQSLKNKSKIKNVYLATDYPLNNNNNTNSKISQSDTWRKITNNHHLAISYLNSSLSINSWVSTRALDYLSDDNRLDPEAVKGELKGSGVQGIIDKLVLINADYFVSGPDKCAKANSFYTEKIRDGRRMKIINDKNSNLKNIGYIWDSKIPETLAQS